MEKNRFRIIVIGLLMFVLLACGILDTVTDTAEQSIEDQASGILFQEDFSDNKQAWGVGDVGDGYLEIANGVYSMQATEAYYIIWGLPGTKYSQNIHLEVTAMNKGPAEDTAFGIICNMVDDENYYYAGFDPLGNYAIVKTTNNEDYVLSGSKPDWSLSDKIKSDANAYRITMECTTDATISLYVDGILLESIKDNSQPYTNGDVGLWIFTYEQPNAEVHFDDFLVKKMD